MHYIATNRCHLILVVVSINLAGGRFEDELGRLQAKIGPRAKKPLEDGSAIL